MKQTQVTVKANWNWWNKMWTASCNDSCVLNSNDMTNLLCDTKHESRTSILLIKAPTLDRNSRFNLFGDILYSWISLLYFYLDVSSLSCIHWRARLYLMYTHTHTHEHIQKHWLCKSLTRFNIKSNAERRSNCHKWRYANWIQLLTNVILCRLNLNKMKWSFMLLSWNITDRDASSKLKTWIVWSLTI